MRQTSGGLRGRIGAMAPWIIIAVGLFLLARPIARQWFEAWQASKGIDAVVATYDVMDDPERVGLRKEAELYNADLFAGADLSQRLPYEQQLSYRGSEMIAYISIPKCSVRLPIYHGTEDKVLMVGVGHLIGTSLPVGGTSSHSVLTAHTGMQGRRMFDDIHLLERGDHFVIWVLGAPIAYEVYASETVLPDEVGSLGIEEGRDLVTLVTCTPYGINSHRLLVHGERCDYEEGEEEMADVAVYVNGRTLPFLIAFASVLLLMAGMLWQRLRKMRDRRSSDADKGMGTGPIEARRQAMRTSSICETGVSSIVQNTYSYERESRFAIMRSIHGELGFSAYIYVIINISYRRRIAMGDLRATSTGLGTPTMLMRLVGGVSALCLMATMGARPAFAEESQRKVAAPAVISYVVQENSTEVWDEIADYAQGEDVPSSLTGTLPADLGYRKSLPYWLVVNIAPGQTYLHGTARAEVWHEDGSTEDITDRFSITFTDPVIRAGTDDLISAVPGLVATDRIRLTYHTRLNEQANKGFEKGNTSWGHLEYGGIGFLSSETSAYVAIPRLAQSIAFAMASATPAEELRRSVEIPIVVYTYDLEIIKRAEDTGQVLSGASFALRDVDGYWYVRGEDWSKDQDKATVFVSDDEGRILIPYLDSEYYEAVELESPRGYLIGDPVDVEITTDVPERSASMLDATTSTAMDVYADAATGLVRLSITDKPENESRLFIPIVPGLGTPWVERIEDTNGTDESEETPTNPSTPTATTTGRTPTSPSTPTVPTVTDSDSGRATATPTPFTNLISRMGLSRTGDNTIAIWPVLILSVLLLVCAVLLRRAHRGWNTIKAARDADAPATEERKEL